MVRVLYVNPEGFIGGAERSLLLLLGTLDRSRFTPVLLTFAEGPLTEQARMMDVPVRSVPVSARVRRMTRLYRSYLPGTYLRLLTSGAAAVVRMQRVIREMDAQIVHTNGMKAHVLGGLAARLRRVPVVWHVRDFFPVGGQGFLLHWLARSLPIRIIANSGATAAQFFGSPRLEAKVRCIPNGVDVTAFTPGYKRGRARREWGIPENTPLVGMVAHLTPWKGHRTFLRAASRVAAELPETRFVLVGGDLYGTDGHHGYRDELAGLAGTLGLGRQLVFAGACEDVREVLADLDVVVHPPSQPEPFGRVLIEAMAMGRPVVASRVGGIPEVVEEGKTGVLVPPDDPEALAVAVVGLLKAPDLRASMGMAGRRRVEDLFTAEQHAVRVAAVYDEVLTDAA